MTNSLHHTLLLVRHCEASGQAADAALTGRGEAQARQLALALAGEPVGRIVSSPHTRAQQSIEPFAAARGLTVELDERLTERVLSGDSRPDWRERLRDSFGDLDVRLSGGETSREATARGRAVLDEMLAGPESCTVVVTHGNMMALLLRSFDETHGYDTWAGMRNPDVYRLRLEGQHTHLERLELPDLTSQHPSRLAALRGWLRNLAR